MNRLVFILISICLSVSLGAQIVEDVLEIRDASRYQYDISPGECITDDEGNYYYVQPQSSYAYDPGQGGIIINEGGLYFNGEKIERGPILDTISEYADFIYLLKFSSDFKLLASNIIMNVNRVQSISVNNGFFSIVIQPSQDFPLIVGDTVYQSSQMTNENWVLVFNEKLDQVEAIHYPKNSVYSAALGKEPGEIFIGVQINELSKYLVLGADTIWNYSDTIAPGIEYQPYTGVVACYNYDQDKYIWMRKFGHVWGESQIKQVSVDPFGDVVVAAISGANDFIYIDDREDSLPASGIRIERQDVAESVLLKFSSCGKYLWGVTTPEAKWDVIRNFSIDLYGNIYIDTYHENDSIQFRDTLLKAIGDESFGFEGRSLLAKFNRDGAFDWVHQLGGAFSMAIYFNINATKSDFVYVSGIFRYGNVEIGDSSIDYDSALGSTYYYTYKINKRGKDEQLIYQSLGEDVEILDVIAHNNESVTMIIKTEPDVEIFGLEYGDPDRVLFVKVDLNELVNNNDIIQNEERVKVFPNPIRRGNRLHIRLDSRFMNQDVQLRLLSLDGREVMIEELNHPSEYIEIAVPKDLTQSAYLLWLKGEEITSAKILIIE